MCVVCKKLLEGGGTVELLQVRARVLRHGCFDWLFIYLVLILVSCFVVLFSVLFRLQLSVVKPNRSQVVRIELPCNDRCRIATITDNGKEANSECQV